MKITNYSFYFMFVISILFLNPLLIRAEEKSVQKNLDQKTDQVDAKTDEKEKSVRPAKEIASSVKDISRAPAQLVGHTIEETKSGPPIMGTIKGIERGAGELTRSAVKGVSNIVSLGHSQQSELEPPEVGTEHKDPAKFKIRIPGT